MMVLLQAVLSAEDVARAQEVLGAAPFLDGRRTAGAAAAAVKRNAQADGRDPQVQALERLVHRALGAHPVFSLAVRPKLISRLLFSRYEDGQTYGPHTDDALMGEAETPLRTDLAFTLFLQPPEAYEGGALCITTPLGVQAIKLPAGDGVVYPAGSIHEVAPVTQGARLAAVGWVQSLVRDSTQRELLFDLAQARSALASTATKEALLKLDKVQAGLLRLWAET
jgi:PKHD-type hydroxylase